MEANQNNPVVETYWELLKNLDAGTRLALIARLAESLQGELFAPAGALPSVFRPVTPGNNSSASNQALGDASDTFWWDSLEE